MRKEFCIFSTIIILVCLICGIFWQPMLWILLPLGALVALGIYDMVQKSTPYGEIPQLLAEEE